MIRPMTKYSFVLYHADADNFLQALQTLGMVDIRRRQHPVDEHSRNLLEQVNRLARVSRQLQGCTKEENAAAAAININMQDHEAVAAQVEKLLAEQDELQQTLPRIEAEINDAEPWGKWHEQDVAALRQMGLTPHFYSIPENNYRPEWEQAHPIQELNRCRGKIYFVALETAGVPCLPGVREARFPRLPHAGLLAEREQLTQRMADIDGQLATLSAAQPLLQKARNRHAEALDVYFAGCAAQKEAEATIVLLTGFAQKAQAKAVKAFLEQQAVVYFAEAARPEDNPPIALKNNRFARHFEVIGDMFMPPNYREKDLTAYFAPFYMLFFGFCLGDMGYGLLLLLAATLAKFRLPKMKSLLTLVQLLGIGAIIMAAIPGTFFGAKIGEAITVADGKEERLWRLGEYTFKFFDDLQMFWFALIFGGVQIVFAKIMQGIFNIQRFGWQYGLSHFGWAMLLAGTGLAIGNVALPQPLLYALLFGGLFLVLFFTHTASRNPLKRLLKGIASLFDVTGLFGDILSYIRLFGLSASGGSLGMVVNVVAGMCMGVPYAGWLIGALILIVGHAAVLALSALGAFVHPMRLTFVEFYKNIGFEGGGKAYRPLKKETE